MSENVIELIHLQKQFGDHAVLHDINLSVKKGEVLSIIGASGSGKSTMLRCINLLETPTSGQIMFHGKDITSPDFHITKYRTKVGMVFQSFNLLPRTTALENVIMPLAYTAGGLSRRECRKRGIEMLERVGLADRIYHYPSQLSGGQQQRVAIARALINHPPVLFADEPTGNLDSRTSEEVMRMFSELNDEGITVILVTHSVEIAGFAKRSIHVQDGQIVRGTYEGKAVQS